MNAPQVFPFREPQDEAHHYLPPHVLAAVKREAAAGGTNDWTGYAQAKLDRELRACSLLLTDEQVGMLRRYADVLGVQPQELLGMLLAPGAARRERWRRRAVTLVQQHRPRWKAGGCCLTITVCALILIALWLTLYFVAALGVVAVRV